MSAELWQQVGRKLREERVHAGITRTEMAQCLGWSVAYLVNVEAGVRPMGASAVSLYASALGMEDEALLA